MTALAPGPGGKTLALWFVAGMTPADKRQRGKKDRQVRGVKQPPVQIVYLAMLK